MIKRCLRTLRVIIVYCMLGIMPNVYSSAPNTVIGTVSDPNHTFNGPFGIALTPDGTKAYVTNNNGTTVSIINVANNTATGTVTDLGTTGTFNFPDFVQITPDGTKAYVTNNSGSLVSVINVATNTVTGTVNDVSAPFIVPAAIAITPDGIKAYITDLSANAVKVVDVATNTVTGNVNDVSGPFQLPVSIAITPDGTKAYVANNTNATVSVIDVATNTVTGAIAIPGSLPQYVAITPDGTKAYVSDDTIKVDIINVATNTLTGTVRELFPRTFNVPLGITITSDSKTAYVMNQNNDTVSIIDVATNTVTGPVSDPDNTFNEPQIMVITPAGTKGYVTNFNNNSVSIISIPAPAASVLSPRALQGLSTSNIFLLQTDFINIISWSAPLGGATPVNYRIYRDAALTDLVVTLPATGQLQYEDHYRMSGQVYTYYVVAVDIQGNVSSAASVSIRTLG